MSFALESARRRTHWMATHGLVRAAAPLGARLGDLQARLISDPQVRVDPGPVHREIRSRGPIARGRLADVTVDHAVVRDVLRSDDFRTAGSGPQGPKIIAAIEQRTRTDGLHPLRPPSLLATEPPSHTTYRRLVSSVFTARAVASMRDNVELTATRLLDELDGETGTVDIIDRYCARLPVAVIGDILGVPEDERDRVLEFGELAAPSLDLGLSWSESCRVDDGLSRFIEWLHGHLARLRENPGDDLMSQLIAARDDGVALTEQELLATAGLVLAAGFETTVNILGSGIDLLTTHRDQLEVLTASPDLWANAADEMLRLRSPVQMTARATVRPTEVGGTTLPADRLILLVLAGANRDPAVFDDPDRFDVTRENANKHHSFSGGRHFCLGAALARAETEVGLQTLFERFPDLVRAGQPVRRNTRVLHGYSSYPVRLHG
ncbi:cytochrome P450 [uncultured Williamsia sp.]|uniref:cytochrome P450 n=1 Tax=uncultured Williamsia sp. TaxID=259311 RepID=UPI0026221383|nr:cytochrome P450 [uncultured Williamsia sp.]